MSVRLQLIPRAVMLLAVAVLGVVLGTGISAAVPVSDCTTIDSPGEYHLTGDVTAIDPADGVCIEIAANRTVLDGDRNAVEGAGNGTGIAVAGADNVTVRDVTMQNWSTGLVVEQGADSFRVTGSDFRGNGIGDGNPGLLLDAGDRVHPPRVVQNAFRENLNGLQVQDTLDATVGGNRFIDNVRSGITVTGDSHLTDITYNVIVGSDLGVAEPEQLASNGIFVSTSQAVQIRRNVIERNGNGVQLYFLAGSAIEHNSIVDNRRGVWVRGMWEQMAAHCNEITGNSDYGIENNGGTAHNVTRNYWGAAGGPGGGATDPETGAVADGGGDDVSSSLHWDPFLRTPGCGTDGDDDDDDDDDESNESPEAELELHPSDPPVDANVLLDGSDSIDADGEITEYRWEIDGETVMFGERVHHRFEEPRENHFVSLTVTDGDGATDTVTRRGIVVWERKDRGEDDGEDWEDDDEDVQDEDDEEADDGDDADDGADADDGDDADDGADADDGDDADDGSDAGDGDGEDDADDRGDVGSDATELRSTAAPSTEGQGGILESVFAALDDVLTGLF